MPYKHEKSREQQHEQNEQKQKKKREKKARQKRKRKQAYIDAREKREANPGEEAMTLPYVTAMKLGSSYEY